MSFRSKTRVEVFVLVASAVVARALSAETSRPPSLPGQEHNRMVCIQTEGKADVFVELPGHFDLGSPTISPDGKTVAFDALLGGFEPLRETWIVGMDGKGLRKIANAAVPRWSPDGKRLLVTCGATAGTASPASYQFLYEFDLATMGSRKVCAGRYGDWSPDGKRIAFGRGGDRTGNSGIHPLSSLLTVNADGSDERQLGPGDWPSWSPDGKKVAFHMSEQGKPPTFWILDVESLKRDCLCVGFFRAQWAADGKTFVSNGLMLGEDNRAHRLPARFWLDKSRVGFFLLDYDVPFSPCVSRDGKTVVFIVDSQTRKKPMFE
jgi:hypothetical protein